MIMANSVFDKDGDKAISKEEYETEEETVIRHKTYMFQNMPFDSLDIVKTASSIYMTLKKCACRSMEN